MANVYLLMQIFLYLNLFSREATANKFRADDDWQCYIITKPMISFYIPNSKMQTSCQKFLLTNDATKNDILTI